MEKEPPKGTVGVRLSQDELAAFARAAREDDRTLSALGRKIITAWLHANGHLP